ncbi:hypothetical protein, partial [uncultured Campylobacter sp.]|uniref:hypothetical protein n=1 Tax=uncultured Campylobacter sp. TaxID=218934 RepID=UPI00261AA76C
LQARKGIYKDDKSGQKRRVGRSAARRFKFNNAPQGFKFKNALHRFKFNSMLRDAAPKINF